MEVVLYRPEIPPNTGNIARLCVNAGVPLGILGEPAFDLSEKAVRRAGLDYWQFLELKRYETWENFLDLQEGKRVFAVTKFGSTCYARETYREGDVLLFGQETKGLPLEIREDSRLAGTLYLPMAEQSRSLNLSNAVAIVLYEALRQTRGWSEEKIK